LPDSYPPLDALVDSLERMGAELIERVETLEDGVADAIVRLQATPAPSLTVLRVLYDLRALLGDDAPTSEANDHA
jgi:hypothetical protein